MLQHLASLHLPEFATLQEMQHGWLWPVEASQFHADSHSKLILILIYKHQGLLAFQVLVPEMTPQPATDEW